MNKQAESMAAIQKLARGEMSIKTRLGYVALLLVSSAMTVVLASLWLTEPSLPIRTQVAFGVMAVIGISWATLSLWALTTRRMLLARDRLIAGKMSVGFTALFLAGALAVAFMSGEAAAYGAAATGALMLFLALRTLFGARRRFAALAAHRAELERELA